MSSFLSLPIKPLSHVQLFCNPMGCSPTGSPIHGISQARILEWVALSFSRGSSWPRNRTHISCTAGEFFITESLGKPLTLFFLVLPLYCYQPISLHPRAHMLSHVIPWTSARQTPLSMDFSRQEYWSGLPFPSPGPYSLLRPISIILSFLWRLSRLPSAHLNTFFLNIPTKHLHDLFFGCTALPAGFQFLDLSNPCLLQWSTVLTTGPPGEVPDS